MPRPTPPLRPRRSGAPPASGGNGVPEPTSGGHGPFVEVVRSPRRSRTVSAYRDGDRTVVLVPARLSREEEHRWVTTMLDRLDRQDRRRRPDDDALLERARQLSRRWLGDGPQPTSVRWVDNQRSRWGSCTTTTGSIRLSSRLQGTPAWVVDYVLVHELAHLQVSSHGPQFWALVQRYPYTERARGFLEGFSVAAGLGMAEDSGPDEG